MSEDTKTIPCRESHPPRIRTPNSHHPNWKFALRRGNHTSHTQTVHKNMHVPSAEDLVLCSHRYAQVGTAMSSSLASLASQGAPVLNDPVPPRNVDGDVGRRCYVAFTDPTGTKQCCIIWKENTFGCPVDLGFRHNGVWILLMLLVRLGFQKHTLVGYDERYCRICHSADYSRFRLPFISLNFDLKKVNKMCEKLMKPGGSQTEGSVRQIL